jgi:hypothetical protein
MSTILTRRLFRGHWDMRIALILAFTMMLACTILVGLMTPEFEWTRRIILLVCVGIGWFVLGRLSRKWSPQ